MLSAYEVPGLELMVSQRQLSHHQWIELIEGRCQSIRRHLEFMPLPELGYVKGIIVGEGHHQRELGFSPVSVGDEGFSLHTRGVFRMQPWEAIEYIPQSGFRPGPGGLAQRDGTKRLWGLTQSGQWVVVTVVVKGEAGYKNRGCERVESVEIVAVDLDQIFVMTKTGPDHIWKALGQEIKQYADHQMMRYRSAQKLAAVVEAEELVYSQVSKKS